MNEDEWKEDMPSGYLPRTFTDDWDTYSLQTQANNMHRHGHKSHHHKHHRGQPSEHHQEQRQRDWDNQALKNMGVPTDRKEDAPDGYKEHIEWTAGGDNVNTKDEIKYEKEDVVKKAKPLAEESEHVKITFPDQAPPKPEKPKPV